MAITNAPSTGGQGNGAGFFNNFFGQPSQPTDNNPDSDTNSQSDSSSLFPGEFGGSVSAPSQNTSVYSASQATAQAQGPITNMMNNGIANQQAGINNSQQVDTNPTHQYNIYTGQLNPNYVPPQNQNNNQTGQPGQQPTTPGSSTTPTTPPVPPGQTTVYNSSGQPINVNSSTFNNGVPQAGNYLNNPKTQNVVSSVPDGQGGTIQQLGDGTYWAVDINGNYQATSADTYQKASVANQAYQAWVNVQNGILTPSQQAQVTQLQQVQAAEMKSLLTENANVTGVQTLAQNLYGMGNTTIGQGVITQTIQAGADRVTELQAKQAEALQALQDAFVKDDSDAIATAAAAFKGNEDAITTSIKDTTTQVQALQTKQEDDLTTYTFQQMANHPDAKITLGMTAAQIQDAVTQSTSYQSKQAIVDNTPIDGSAPDPTTANIPNSITGLTPNQLWQDSQRVILQGVSPKTLLGIGLGTATGTQGAALQALNRSVAAITAAAGVDLPTVEAEWKANATALNSLTTTMTAINANVQSAQQQISTVTNQFSNAGVNLYDSTYLNRTLNDLSTNFLNSDQLSSYKAGVAEVQNTYSQIFQRGGATTDAANAKASDIVNGDMTLQRFMDVTSELQSQAEDFINSQIAIANATATGGSMAEVTKFLQYINSNPSSTGSSGSGSTDNSGDTSGDNSGSFSGAAWQ